jgi:hypothetical protein
MPRNLFAVCRHPGALKEPPIMSINKADRASDFGRLAAFMRQAGKLFDVFCLSSIFSCAGKG